jgi:hypothetical protein
MTKTHQDILTEIVADYAPYETLAAFGEGFVAYQHGTYRNPYEGLNAQAWDRGANAAMRYARALRQQQ